MTSWTNTSRHSATFTNVGKTATTWDNLEQSGSGWIYDEVNLTYNAVLDLDSNNPVYYNGFGAQAAWTNIAKS